MRVTALHRVHKVPGTGAGDPQYELFGAHGHRLSGSELHFKALRLEV